MRAPRGLAPILLISTACSSDPAVIDASTDDASTRDASTRDDATASDDAATLRDADPTADGGGGSMDPRGFTIRVPQRRMVPCVAGQAGGCPSAMVEEPDLDFVCTLEHGARRGYFVYVQNRPVRRDAAVGLVPLPIYSQDGTYLSDGARVVTEGFAATYDFGGGHHNDSLTIDLTDLVYRYYHSSFGFGFRRCQEVDCLQVFQPGSATPTEDGCTRDRTLPVVCVRVGEDGTVPPLTDTFMRCPGDT